jgi:hypothetical protein
MGSAFPYVFDETQEIARGFGAQRTPDFFGFNAPGELHAPDEALDDAALIEESEQEDAGDDIEEENDVEDGN